MICAVAGRDHAEHTPDNKASLHVYTIEHSHSNGLTFCIHYYIPDLWFQLAVKKDKLLFNENWY